MVYINVGTHGWVHRRERDQGRDGSYDYNRRIAMAISDSINVTDLGGLQDGLSNTRIKSFQVYAHSGQGGIKALSPDTAWLALNDYSAPAFLSLLISDNATKRLHIAVIYISREWTRRVSPMDAARMVTRAPKLSAFLEGLSRAVERFRAEVNSSSDASRERKEN
jgi:hypothetical protein